MKIFIELPSDMVQKDSIGIPKIVAVLANAVLDTRDLAKEDSERREDVDLLTYLCETINQQIVLPNELEQTSIMQYISRNTEVN